MRIRPADITFSLLACVALGGVGCDREQPAAQPSPPAAPAAAPSDAESDPQQQQDRFTIEFPRSWQISRNQMGMALIAAAPPDNADDLFNEGVQINEIANPAGLDLAAFYAQQFRPDVAERMLTNFQHISENDVMIGGRPAKRTVYRHRIGQFDVTALVFTIVTDTHGYVITCSAEDELFNSYRDRFEQAVMTFRAR